MQEDYYRAEVTITGCGLGPPAISHFELCGCGDDYRISCKDEFDGEQTVTFCNVSEQEVDHQFDLLRNASVCAYPVSPLVCDGEYVEVTIHGVYASLTMGWWTFPPDSADVLFNFSEWMRQRFDPDRYQPFDDSDDV